MVGVEDKLDGSISGGASLSLLCLDSVKMRFIMHKNKKVYNLQKLYRK